MKLTLKHLVSVFMLVILGSCAENLDFNQVNLDIEPVVNLPIASFELNQDDLFDEDNSIEITRVEYTSDFEALESSVIKNNLTQATFNFEVENRFDRSFQIQLTFLDDNDNITFSDGIFNIAAGNLNYTATRRIVISSSPNFLNSTKVNIVVLLRPSTTTIDPDVPKIISFKSTGIFYLTF